jgi:hypothetical protein
MIRPKPHTSGHRCGIDQPSASLPSPLGGERARVRGVLGVGHSFGIASGSAALSAASAISALIPPPPLSALRANTAQRQIKCRHLKPIRQRHLPQRRPRRQLNIRHLTALLAEKMAVLPHVRAEPRRAPIQRHLPHQPALHQHAQAIINRRERNLRHPLLRPLKNLIRRRMIIAPRHHLKNLAPLPRRTKSPHLERMLKTLRKSMDMGFRYAPKNMLRRFTVNECSASSCARRVRFRPRDNMECTGSTALWIRPN